MLSGLFWRYTPSRMSPKDLEAIMVQREPLLARLEDLAADSTEKKGKHFVMLVGPRGIGKTHLLSVLYHRLRAREDLEDRLVIAWLEEDPWDLTTTTHLFRAIAEAISDDTDEDRAAKLEHLPDLPRDSQDGYLRDLIRDAVGDRTLLVLLENFDEILDAIGDLGQKELRSFLQQFRQCSMIATAQSLSNDVKDRDAPFHGFFRILHVDPLNAESARELLERIALERGKNELVALLRGPLGRERVRALNSLVGGNPRLYLIFADFLATENLDRLTEPVMKTIDELTPYYQDRMKSISRQQRLIVAHLSERAGPAPVKEIARQCLITEQTASSQLRELRERLFVADFKIGRETYYEIREPLMRLALGVKRNARRPTELLIDFLRLWHTRGELNRRLMATDDPDEKERYGEALLAHDESSKDPVLREMYADALKAAEEGRFEEALVGADKLVARRGEANDFHLRGGILDKLGRHDEAIDATKYALELGGEREALLVNLGIGHLKKGDLDEAEKILEEIPESSSEFARAAFNLGTLEEARKNWLEAIAHYERVKPSADQARHFLFRIAYCYGKARDHERSLEHYRRFFEVVDTDAAARSNMGLQLKALGRREEMYEAFRAALDDNPNDADAFNLVFNELMRDERREEAEKLVRDAAERPPEAAAMWNAIGVRFDQLDHLEDALHAFDAALAIEEHKFARFNRAEALLGLGRWEIGTEALIEALERYGESENYFGDVRAIVANLLERTPTVAAWERMVPTLVQAYCETGAEATKSLGEALVRSLEHLRLPIHSQQARSLWTETWTKAGAEHDELSLSLRLLDIGTRFLNEGRKKVGKKEIGDKKIIFEATNVEREILVDVLKLEPVEYGVADPDESQEPAT